MCVCVCVCVCVLNNRALMVRKNPTSDLKMKIYNE